MIVKPNERLPADGFVIKGEGSVNQTPITGESLRLATTMAFMTLAFSQAIQAMTAPILSNPSAEVPTRAHGDSLNEQANAPLKAFGPVMDAQRATCLTRAHAVEWGIDPKQIGIMGFLAGGETVGLTAILGENSDRSHRYSSLSTPNPATWSGTAI